MALWLSVEMQRALQQLQQRIAFDLQNVETRIKMRNLQEVQQTKNVIVF
jgi:hypothetical protein